MEIYTSRYGNKEIAEIEIIPVGISLYHPRFKLAFKVPYKIRELAPTRDMLDMAYAPYKRKYTRMLNALSVDALEEQFVTISGKQNKDLVLLCFEDLSKKGEWCHRQMFADWWHQKTGYVIKEL